MLADYDSCDEIQSQPMVDPNSQDLNGVASKPRLLSLQCTEYSPPASNTGHVTDCMYGMTKLAATSELNSGFPVININDSIQAQTDMEFGYIDFPDINNESEAYKEISLPHARNVSTVSSTLLPDLLQDYSESRGTESNSPELAVKQDINPSKTQLAFSADIPTNPSGFHTDATIHVPKQNCSEYFDQNLGTQLERRPHVPRAGNNDSPLLTQLLNDTGPRSVTSPALKKFLDAASPERNILPNAPPRKTVQKTLSGRRRTKYRKPPSLPVLNKTFFGNLYHKKSFPKCSTQDRRFSAFSQVVPKKQNAPGLIKANDNPSSEADSDEFNSKNVYPENANQKYSAVKFLLETKEPIPVQNSSSIMPPCSFSPLVSDNPQCSSPTTATLSHHTDSGQIPSDEKLVVEILTDAEFFARVNDDHRTKGSGDILNKPSPDLLAQAVSESGLVDQSAIVMSQQAFIDNIQPGAPNQDLENPLISDEVIQPLAIIDSLAHSVASAENKTSIESVIDSALSIDGINESVLDPDFFLSKDTNIPIEGSDNEWKETDTKSGSCATYTNKDVYMGGPGSPSSPTLHSQSSNSIAWFNFDKDISLLATSPGKVFESSESEEEDFLNRKNVLPSSEAVKCGAKSDCTKPDDLLDASTCLDYKSIRETLLQKADKPAEPAVETVNVENSVNNVTSHESNIVPDQSSLEMTPSPKVPDLAQTTGPSIEGDTSQCNKVADDLEGNTTDESRNSPEVLLNKTLPCIEFDELSNASSAPYKPGTSVMPPYLKMMAESRPISHCRSAPYATNFNLFSLCRTSVNECQEAPSPLTKRSTQNGGSHSTVAGAQSAISEHKLALDNSRDDCFITGEDPPTMPQQVTPGSLSWLRQALSRANPISSAKQVGNSTRLSNLESGARRPVSRNMDQPLKTQAAYLAAKIVETNQEMTSLDVKSGELSIQMAAAPDHSLHQMHIQILEKQQKLRQKLSHMLVEYKTLYQMSQPLPNTLASKQCGEQSTLIQLGKGRCSPDVGYSPFKSRNLFAQSNYPSVIKAQGFPHPVFPARPYSQNTDAKCDNDNSSDCEIIPDPEMLNSKQQKRSLSAPLIGHEREAGFVVPKVPIMHHSGQEFPDGFNAVGSTTNVPNAPFMNMRMSDVKSRGWQHRSSINSLGGTLAAPPQIRPTSIVRPQRSAFIQPVASYPPTHMQQLTTQGPRGYNASENLQRASVPFLESANGTGLSRHIQSEIHPQSSASAQAMPTFSPSHIQHSAQGPVGYNNLSENIQPPRASSFESGDLTGPNHRPSSQMPRVTSISNTHPSDLPQPRPSATLPPQYSSMPGPISAPGFFLNQPYSGMGQPMHYPMQGAVLSPFYGWGMFGTPMLGMGPVIAPPTSSAVGVQYNNSNVQPAVTSVTSTSFQTAPAPVQTGPTSAQIAPTSVQATPTSVQATPLLAQTAPTSHEPRKSREALRSMKKRSLSRRKPIPINPKPKLSAAKSKTNYPKPAFKRDTKPLAKSESVCHGDVKRKKSENIPFEDINKKTCPPEDSSKLVTPIKGSSVLSDSNKECRASSPKSPEANAYMTSKDETRFLQPPSVRRRKRPINPIGTPNKKEQDSKKCPECKETFMNLEELARHRFSEHKQQFVYWCEQCKKGYNDPRCIIEHKARHEGRKFECHECEKTFKSLTGYRRHQSEHTGNFLYK